MGKLIQQADVILSKNKRSTLEDNVEELVNAIDDSLDAGGSFEDKVVTHLDLFNNSRSVSFEAYVKACEFATRFYTHHNMTDAWVATFPIKAAIIENKEGSETAITAAASSFFHGKMVQQILAQSAVGLGVFYSGYSHKAVQKLFMLMESNDSTPRIQMESADKLLNHLKDSNVDKKLDLNINVTHKTDFVGDVQEAMNQMLQKQKAAIEAGMDLKTVANVRIGSEPEIIEGEIDG